IVGNGYYNYLGGDGGPAINAGMGIRLGALTIDRAGNLFIADEDNNLVRVVKGVAERQHQVTISSVKFTKPPVSIKPTLTIIGLGFGASGATVNINGKDISKF